MRSYGRIILTSTHVVAARVSRIKRRCVVEKCAALPQPTPDALVDAFDWSEIVQSISDAVSDCGVENAPIALVIPACWCYCHRLTLPGRRFDESAAAYELEEFLPVPLEDVTTAFAWDTRTTLGIAVRTRPLRELLNELEFEHIAISAVYVDALACAAAHAASGGTPTGLVVRDGRRITFLCNDSIGNTPQVVRPLLCPVECCPDVFMEQQKARTSAAFEVSACTWHVCDLRGTLPLSSTPLDEASRHFTLSDGDGLDTTIRASVDHAACPDLRKGALAAGSAFTPIASATKTTLLLLTIMLLSIVLDQRFEIEQCDRHLALLHQQQVEVYQTTMPGSTVRANFALQLASERRRMDAVTRGDTQSSDGDTLARRRCSAALDALRDFVAKVPDDVRLLVQDVNLDEQQFAIRGLTTDHRDAERLTEAVNKLTDWVATTPRTSRVREGGVEFTIRAHRRSNDD